jgi:FKBP-type peptidyl-prolyl cis-trans isomerase SlyD
MASITKGKIVEVRYKMKSSEGEILDETAEPETYVHGSGSMLPALERALDGKSAGDKLSVTLEPADAFGQLQKSAGPQAVPRATFPPDADLKPGMKFSAETPDGSPVALFITRVADDAVYVDTNHPFAGRSLEFDIEVLAVSDPPEG